MGDEKNNWRFSLKELLGVMTWMTFAFAFVRMGYVHESKILLMFGVSMVLIGVSGAAGLFLDGWQGVWCCAVTAMCWLILIWLFVFVVAQ